MQITDINNCLYHFIENCKYYTDIKNIFSNYSIAINQSDFLTISKKETGLTTIISITIENLVYSDDLDFSLIPDDDKKKINMLFNVIANKIYNFLISYDTITLNAITTIEQREKTVISKENDTFETIVYNRDLTTIVFNESDDLYNIFYFETSI